MKRLQDSTVSDNVVLHALGNIGLGNHGILFQRFHHQKLNIIAIFCSSEYTK